MKTPKTLKLFGDEWKIKMSKRESSFNFSKKIIKVDKRDSEEGFFHELLELIMVQNYNRFYGGEGSMEYMFIMNHTDFCRFVKEVVQVLKDNKLLK